MQVERLAVGPMQANSYLVFTAETREALVIDPGGEADKILTEIDDKQLNVKFVVNTHGHIDHIAANQEVINNTGAELLIHKADAEFLTDPELNLSRQLGRGEVTSPPADELLEEDSRVEIGELSLRVIHTPGHTPGGICLQGKKVLFTGDTLFRLGIGRTDFPQASGDQIQKSLDKLMEFDEDFAVYPGHGPTSTLTEVKNKNMYL